MKSSMLNIKEIVLTYHVNTKHDHVHNILPYLQSKPALHIGQHFSLIN